MTTVIGFTITQHHCGDSMQYTHIDNIDECGCNNSCGMCEIETNYFHLGANFVVEHSAELNITPSISFSSLLENIVSTNNFTIIPQSNIKSSPPILEISTRLALIQSFRC